MNQFSILWGVLLLGFLIAEAACPLHLISLWFAAGSVVALILNWIGLPLRLQIVAFVVVSGVLLGCLWPLTKKYLNPGHQATNLDSILGAECYVTASIDNVHAQGQVKLNGMEWTARSTSGSPIAEGALVKVDRIEGVKLYVSLAEVKV